ncbi:hypothetical protein [Ilyobacter polytropus]|uniref:Uncharacterized protein n=1 Tax=Ilyobacter polytropus (strain ATCC 51220 / DSM 2926 / LMG 16218 / CuHBu1) TaxID=572544 RepID=E3HD18_ILYPC|nr:hypothetical protein [Ilyobacter polytropus]ADO84494.1 hypothetical protein Ilyop_2739 [Ilyobacter polytropus DSM 2926]
MELKGLFELESALKKINDNGTINKYKEIFSENFMIDNTQFDDIEDFFYFGKIEIKPIEEYSTVEIWMIDEAVDKYTDFSTWDEFFKAAKGKG